MRQSISRRERVVHVRGNDYAPWVELDGTPVQANTGSTRVRKDEVGFAVSDGVFPTEIDMPCDSGRADRYFGRFECR